MSETAAPGENLDPAAVALLDLAREQPWSRISLRDVADRAGVELVDLYGETRGKAAIVWRISEMLDRAALRTDATASEDPHDRLFDAAMARIEAMEPYRAALVALSREAPRLVVAAHLPATARAILEAAGVPATPPRVAAMALVWARVIQVWRDDEGALNRTMAELDKRLRQLRSRLGRIGAGF